MQSINLLVLFLVYVVYCCDTLCHFYIGDDNLSLPLIALEYYSWPDDSVYGYAYSTVVRRQTQTPASYRCIAIVSNVRNNYLKVPIRLDAHKGGLKSLSFVSKLEYEDARAVATESQRRRNPNWPVNRSVYCHNGQLSFGTFLADLPATINCSSVYYYGFVSDEERGMQVLLAFASFRGTPPHGDSRYARIDRIVTVVIDENSSSSSMPFVNLLELNWQQSFAYRIGMYNGAILPFQLYPSLAIATAQVSEDGNTDSCGDVYIVFAFILLSRNSAGMPLVTWLYTHKLEYWTSLGIVYQHEGDTNGWMQWFANGSYSLVGVPTHRRTNLHVVLLRPIPDYGLQKAEFIDQDFTLLALLASDQLSSEAIDFLDNEKPLLSTSIVDYGRSDSLHFVRGIDTLVRYYYVGSGGSVSLPSDNVIRVIVAHPNDILYANSSELSRVVHGGRFISDGSIIYVHWYVVDDGGEGVDFYPHSRRGRIEPPPRSSIVPPISLDAYNVHAVTYAAVQNRQFLVTLVRDCNGVPGGAGTYDICGVCDGDGCSCVDCLRVPNHQPGQCEDHCGCPIYGCKPDPASDPRLQRLLPAPPVLSLVVNAVIQVNEVYNYVHNLTSSSLSDSSGSRELRKASVVRLYSIEDRVSRECARLTCSDYAQRHACRRIVSFFARFTRDCVRFLFEFGRSDVHCGSMSVNEFDWSHSRQWSQSVNVDPCVDAQTSSETSSSSSSSR